MNINAANQYAQNFRGNLYYSPNSVNEETYNKVELQNNTKESFLSGFKARADEKLQDQYNKFYEESSENNNAIITRELRRSPLGRAIFSTSFFERNEAFKNRLAESSYDIVVSPNEDYTGMHFDIFDEETNKKAKKGLKDLSFADKSMMIIRSQLKNKAAYLFRK